MQDKIKVLMVCHGNICRSPMAEFVLKDMVSKRGIADQFEIAAVATSTEEIWNGVGNPVYPSIISTTFGFALFAITLLNASYTSSDIGNTLVPAAVFVFSMYFPLFPSYCS